MMEELLDPEAAAKGSRQKRKDRTIVRRHANSDKEPEWFRLWGRLRWHICNGDTEQAQALADTLARTSPGRRGVNRFVPPPLRRGLDLE